eukprot:3142042-Pyramimonas_sp.AAC.1
MQRARLLGPSAPQLCPPAVASNSGRHPKSPRLGTSIAPRIGLFVELGQVKPSASSCMVPREL